MSRRTVHRKAKLFLHVALAALLFAVIPGKCQTLSGDTIVYSRKSFEYRLSPSPNLVEWRIYPPGVGQLVEIAPGAALLQINNTGSGSIKTCSLMAYVPNLQGYLNIVKRLHIEPDTTEPTVCPPYRFSGDPRITVKVLCDSSRTYRRVVLTDSAALLGKTTPLWTLLNEEGRKIAASSGASVQLTVTPGTYTIRLKRHQSAKAAELSDTMTFFPVPEFSFRVPTAVICENAPLAFSVQATPATPGCLLTMHFGDEAHLPVYQPDQVTYHRYAMSGNIYQPYLQLQDAYGCTFSSPVQHVMVKKNTFQPINVFIDPVQASLSGGRSVAIRCSVTQQASQNFPLSYNWSAGSSSDANTITVSQPGFYYVKVTDKIGCEGPVLKAVVGY